jgi:hypothetical protein
MYLTVAASVYSVFFVLAIAALWPKRRRTPGPRFLAILLVAPITELLLIMVSIPVIYINRVRDVNRIIQEKEIIEKYSSLRKTVGGLRVVD